MTHPVPLSSSNSARELLGTQFGPSRLVRSTAIATHIGRDVYLKLENELPTGSFKVRGAYIALWAQTRRARVSEVVAASTGNHGAAVAWAGRELGVAARIFVPLGVNARKAQRIRELGAHLTEVGRGIEDARAAAESYVAEGDAFLLDDATSDDVPAGAGTIGVEVVEQLPGVATVVIPVGDSALIRGVAAAVKSVRADVRVVGVQSSGAPAYYRSWKAGHVITTETADTIADGLATTRPTVPNVAGIGTLVDEMVLVTDDELLDAMRLLLGSEGIVAEPAGAASVAALMRGSGSSGSGPVVALITGGNVAPEVAERVAASVSDAPNGQ